ncbi:Serine/threonine-protein kinase PknB [Pirellula sp. SH-Sr6A]|uniref:serine/threonine protein kinase n=1 Tax=Pirellula sp. SH-Sr6A TaxID=1632865 RepID=UPI00078C0DDE|nr:serine/threonine-protein kinase [Pirellula sp. SH-Sr6A]AMV35560.1 Serine/threonine-protein kinase PknB [Pirellula sp. SH-Sr6A]
MNSGVNKLQILFAEIASRPKDEWPDLLVQLTKNEPELRVPLEALLIASREPDSLLDPVSLHAIDESREEKCHDAFELSADVSSALVGQGRSSGGDPGLTTYDMRVLKPDLSVGGRYRLVERIGEGGMGEVWMARQSEPVKRSVAIKLIKAGMDSKSVLARFEAERQALAMMDHPNIAKVLDGGLMPDGQPFFVMELVKGTPITDFCDRMKLSPEKRLELFIPVCNAIQHAHQKGIIHRDIKPSNVLVALFDDVPVPKVIDFGIAKATGGGLTDQSVYTLFGGIVGTPQYMSPEQATLNNLDIDTRSDVYSLGVLLYELLAGAPPFSQMELEKAGVLEILRVVREVEPQRPSAKLSSSHLVATLSANRSSEPQRLTRLLRSELDWIVLKALEKERSNRYDSAQGFAADILRYLEGEQVLAHPPTLMYRLRKVAHRNRKGLVALSAVLLALLAGLAGTSWQMLRANREASRALTLADNAKRAKEEAENALIVGMMRPLGVGDLEEGSVARTTIADIATLESSELKLKILDRAIRMPQVADRLPTQMAWILQACVGLDASSHQKAAENALTLFRDDSLDHRVRYAALSCLNELDEIGVLSIDEFARYVREAPQERKEGVWESLVWVNLRDNPDALVDFLFACLTGQHGPDALSFACADLEKLASNDPIFAEKVIHRLDHPDLRDVWLNSTDATINVPSIYSFAAVSGEQSYSSNPFSLRVKTISSAYPTDPLQRVRAYCEVDRMAKGSNAKVTGAPLMDVPDFWNSLAESNNEVFLLGVEVAMQYLPEMFARKGSDFLYQNSDSLYKVSAKLSPAQAVAIYDLLAKDIGVLYSYTNTSRGDAVIGVALNQVGPKLSSEDASRSFQKLSDQLSIDRRYGTVANSLLAIAGVASAPGFAEHRLVVDRMLEHLPKVNVNYVRNACWNSIVDVADQLDPKVLTEVSSLIQTDLESQLALGQFDAPEILVDHLVRLSKLGAEVDFDTKFLLLIADYVRSSYYSEAEGALALKMLNILSPESRRNTAAAALRELDGSNWKVDLLQDTPLESALLQELSEVDQHAFVEAIWEFLNRQREDEIDASTRANAIGKAMVSLSRNWPDNKRMLLVQKALSKLREQLSLDDSTKSEATMLIDCMIRFLVDSWDGIDERQKHELSSLLMQHGLWNTGLSDEEFKTILKSFNSVQLAALWKARVSRFLSNPTDWPNEDNPSDTTVHELAAIGFVWFEKDRSEYLKAFSELLQSVDSARFARLAFDLTSFKLQQTKEEFQSTTVRAANRLLTQEPVHLEVIAFADDYRALSKHLLKIECVGDLRDALLTCLEQLAFPDEAETPSVADKIPHAMIDGQEWSHSPGETRPARKHFRSLRDFMLWNLSRPSGERWLELPTSKVD